MSANYLNGKWRRRAGIGLAGSLLAFASLHANASATLDPDCPTIAAEARLDAIAASPPLRLEMTEHDVRDPVTVDRLADSVTASERLADLAPNNLRDGLEVENLPDRHLVGKEGAQAEPNVSPGAQSAGLPATATRLPGIADDQLSRFRRHMFRTDI